MRQLWWYGLFLLIMLLGVEKEMPSFDVVSEVDMHEMNNAIDQANREVDTRFDFKGVDSKFELIEQEGIHISA